ncbi:MAG: carbonic anhydrase [Burkholderiaceae bacterium]|nr:carbonic anhydrase [Burkholderiaceae bacterium]
MISRIEELLRNNRAFVEQQLQLDPGYFGKLAEGQHPGFLWVGCSDSRVPPDRITGTSPGDMFVHRNIANLVVQTDMNFLSVLQYAVEVLQVQHVIVCGHYGCGGVKAAMGHEHHGLIDNWLRTVKDTQQYFWHELKDLGEAARFDRLVELNVIEQVYNLGKTHTIQAAWARNRRPYIHGWVFDLRNGYIRPQTGMINDNDKIGEVCKFTNGIVGGALRAAA